MSKLSFSKKLVLATLFFIILISFIYFHPYSYLNSETLQKNQYFLFEFKNAHYFILVLLYIGLYVLFATAALPGTPFFMLVGGYLFGAWFGAIYAIIGATLGSLLFVTIVRKTFTQWFRRKASVYLQKIETNFQKNAFHYLLSLRLTPILPFWVVNTIAALMKIRTKVFISATIVGILPTACIYSFLGHRLERLMQINHSITPTVLLNSNILLLLFGLALLAVLPILYKWVLSSKNL